MYEIIWKNIVDPSGHRRQYSSCALHTGYISLQEERDGPGM